MNDQNTDDEAPLPTDRRPLGYWLRTVDALVTRELDAAFAAEGVTRRDWMMLNALAGDADAPGLADRIARKGKRLRALEDRGWVDQRGDGTWVVTDEGRSAKERLAATVDGIRTRVSGAIGEDAFAATMASLAAIARELGWSEDDPFPDGGFRPGRGFGGRRGFGPGFGPVFGRGFGPGFGPGHGPEHGPGHGPGFGPGHGPGFGPGHGYRPSSRDPHAGDERHHGGHQGHPHQGHPHKGQPHHGHPHQGHPHDGAHRHSHHGGCHRPFDSDFDRAHRSDHPKDETAYERGFVAGFHARAQRDETA